MLTARVFSRIQQHSIFRQHNRSALPTKLVYTYCHFCFSTMAAAPSPSESIVVPEGYTLHSENTAHILLPSDNGAFLNPIQEFNRDLSVACIRTWGDLMNEEKRKRAEASEEKARAKRLKSELYLLFLLDRTLICVEDPAAAETESSAAPAKEVRHNPFYAGIKTYVS